MPAFWDAAEAEGVAAAALLAAEAVEADAGRVGVPLVGPVGFFAGDLSLGGVGAGIESFPLFGFLGFSQEGWRLLIRLIWEFLPDSELHVIILCYLPFHNRI
jgi:hypothetical protein